MTPAEKRVAYGFFAAAVALVVWLNWATSSGTRLLGAYGTGAISYLLVKLYLSGKYRPVDGPVPDVTVAVVIPVYNEDHRLLRACLDSLAAQTRLPDQVYVVDDGSHQDDIGTVARSYPWVTFRQYPSNWGKRWAQAFGFQNTTCDVILTIDSDCVLAPDAIEEGLKPFVDPDVEAVCGSVKGLNPDANLLTRLLGVRYTNSFLYERAAHDTLDSLMCGTGAITFYRARLIKHNLDDYLQQTFLGRISHYGDDRRLSNYVLRSGRRMVLQDTAISYTMLPERMNHFLRQQIRWNKSFFRETLWLLRNVPYRPAYWAALTEITLWLAFSLALIWGLIIRPILVGQWVALYYLGFMSLMAYTRTVRHRDVSRLAFWLAPLYGLIHVIILTPLRYYSLFTLRDGGWGTRHKGIEVTL